MDTRVGLISFALSSLFFQAPPPRPPPRPPPPPPRAQPHHGRLRAAGAAERAGMGRKARRGTSSNNHPSLAFSFSLSLLFAAAALVSFTGIPHLFLSLSLSLLQLCQSLFYEGRAVGDDFSHPFPSRSPSPSFTLCRRWCTRSRRTSSRATARTRSPPTRAPSSSRTTGSSRPTRTSAAVRVHGSPRGPLDLCVVSVDVDVCVCVCVCACVLSILYVCVCSCAGWCDSSGCVSNVRSCVLLCGSACALIPAWPPGFLCVAAPRARHGHDPSACSARPESRALVSLCRPDPILGIALGACLCCCLEGMLR